MSWKIALVVALLTAVITAVVTAPVADRLTKLHGVSDFEGARGMLIAFVLLPAGFIGGALLGLLGTKLVHATEWPQLWKALGLSVVLGQVVLFGIAGLSMLSIPRPPRIDGQRLALEVELHVPMQRITERSREPDQIRLSLYAGPKDNAYATIDRSRFQESQDTLIVMALADLNSRSMQHVISFHIEEHTWLAFDLNRLPQAPTERDREWSALEPLRDARNARADAAKSDVLLRYRVVDAAE